MQARRCFPVIGRSFVHLLVLAVIASTLPIFPAPAGSPEWVEDVGIIEEPDSTSAMALLPGAQLTVDPDASQSESEQTPPARSGLSLETYLVQPGDTLASVAAANNLSTETLIWANELADPDLLPVGSKLMIPPTSGVLHRAGPGDTVADLASFYGASLSPTIQVNGLEPPFIILVGQRLLLPGGKMPLVKAPDVPNAPVEPAPLKNDVETPRESTALAARVVPAPGPLPFPAGANQAQASFILKAAEAGRASQAATGVPASVTIAQAILETFWGSSRLSRENNNYFGIKAKERPGSAGVVWYDVWEVSGGANVIQREPFRAYYTVAESFIDHGRFFQQNRRYAAALAARADPRHFAREINRAGYATDPTYASKLIGLMDRFNLYAYDEA